MTWLITYWKPLAGALVIAGLLAGGYALRGMVDQPVIVTAKADASAARANTVATQHARAVEQTAQQQDAQASTDYQKGLQDGKQDLGNALTRLRTTLQLREQQLAQLKQQHLPTDASAPGRRNGEEKPDFLAAHGDDALQLASEADDITRQLTACQTMLGNR